MFKIILQLTLTQITAHIEGTILLVVYRIFRESIKKKYRGKETNMVAIVLDLKPGLDISLGYSQLI